MSLRKETVHRFLSFSLIFLLPRSRFQSTKVLSGCGRSCEFTHAFAAHIPVRTCKLCVISHYLGMPPPENNYYNEVILNDPTLTVNNPVEGHEIQIIIGSPSKG